MRSALLMLALCLPAWAAGPTPRKAVPLEVSGDTVTVVKSFPCQVTAKAGADFYLWSVPDAVKATSADNVLTITAAPEGTHRIAVVAVTVAIDFDAKKKTVTKDAGQVGIVVGVPKPPDPPGPKPPDPPGPDAKGPLRVLVVFDEETAGELPKEQHSVIYGKRFADCLNARTAPDATLAGRRRWFILDKDTSVAGLPAEWRDMHKRPRTSLPWIVLFGDAGAVYHEGPLPGTPDEAVALVEKHAPKKGGKP